MGLLRRANRDWIRETLDTAEKHRNYLAPQAQIALLRYLAAELENHEDALRNLEDCFLPLVEENIGEAAPPRISNETMLLHFLREKKTASYEELQQLFKDTSVHLDQLLDQQKQIGNIFENPKGVFRILE